ncbi:MAG: nucleotidyltransferase family protein [Paludibacteraceae bacterium]|nr:nucleotidyltransferase family protein [Paludibacteraceae bacterium]
MNQAKEAIILAGGFGTRLKHIVSDVPKPMAPINGTPFLAYLLQKLATAGFEHVILSTGYLHEKIESHFGNAFGSLRISYSEESTPLGTGGAILLAMQKVETDNVFVLNGDTLFDIDFNSLEEFHFQHKALLSISLREEADVARYGSVVVNEDGKITAFAEKNQAHGKGLINGGIYVVNKALFANLNMPAQFSFEKDIMEKLYTTMDFYALECKAYFIDIGVPDDYNRAQQEFPQLTF